MNDWKPSHTFCCSSQAGEAGKPLLPGAGLVFFSGGTALNETARALARQYPSTHIVTTFDSGGSTAELRNRLNMPAVGDIRARLLALADDSQPKVVALKHLMAYRLPRDEEFLEAELTVLREGSHPVLENLSGLWAEMGRYVRQCLKEFMPMAGDTFDFGGACVGNILLAVEYFRCNKDLQQAVDILGGYLNVQGRVVPVSETLAHLVVSLESGQTLVGQHRFTGKWEQQIQSPIADIWLVQEAEVPSPPGCGADPAPGHGLGQGDAGKKEGEAQPKAGLGADVTAEQGERGFAALTSCSPLAKAAVPASKLVFPSIAEAQCLCYPIGSFFSSVAANLLVKGVGQSIASASCPKIFIPNPGADPELLGLTLLEQVRFLLRLLQRDAPTAKPSAFINGIVIDRRGAYVGGVAMDALQTMGIELYEACLLDEKALSKGELHICGDLLAKELLRFFTTDPTPQTDC